MDSQVSPSTRKGRREYNNETQQAPLGIAVVIRFNIHSMDMFAIFYVIVNNYILLIVNDLRKRAARLRNIKKGRHLRLPVCQ